MKKYIKVFKGGWADGSQKSPCPFVIKNNL